MMKAWMFAIGAAAFLSAAGLGLGLRELKAAPEPFCSLAMHPNTPLYGALAILVASLFSVLAVMERYPRK